MKCPSNTQLCTGPYSEDACDPCGTLEGEKCVNTPPRKGKINFKDTTTADCGGPFVDRKLSYRCSDCTELGKTGKPAWERLVVDRKNKKSWKATLKTIQVKEVYDGAACVDLTPSDIDEQYNTDAKNGVQRDWCPWVKIGNLYTTITTGNDAGWRLLIENHIQPNDKLPRAISVFTGRHGHPEGSIVQSDNQDLFWDGVPDANHYLQDILQKVVADGHFSGRAESEKPEIKLWDVGTTAGANMTKTQQLATERLRKGEVVIFAWCWSFLSFYKVTDKQSASLKKWDKDLAFNKPIKAIVDDKYGWTRVSKTLTVGTPSEVKWLSSDWRKAVGADRTLAKKELPALFPTGLTSEKLRDTKDTLIERLDERLHKSTHNH
ncbi:MAG: hypothetical protein ABI442_01995 [Gemmatimonadaceae bacterium]